MVAPDAVSVVLAPEQIAVEVDVTEMVGAATMDTVIEAILPVHVPLAPFTV